MDINGTSIGASTYALKKAMETPYLMFNLVQQMPDTVNRSLNTAESPVIKQASDPATITGKGRLIDIVG